MKFDTKVTPQFAEISDYYGGNSGKLFAEANKGLVQQQ